MHSPDLTQTNIARIAEWLPECVTETRGRDGQITRAVDFDVLRQALSESLVEGPQERYHLNWPGKREALLTANAPIAKTLRPCREESVDFDTTQNLFIEGDNLDALKLLQETYLGKVKMIYIDPPYNTGNDFIYKDNFAEDFQAYLFRSNQKDGMGNNLIANTYMNGRIHSNWLSMIYSRLRLARNLISDDGVIALSIDESEYSSLIKIMDEIFGADNLLATFVWKTRQASGKQVASSNVSIEHEYLVVYSKYGGVCLKGVKRDSASYKNPDNDPRGPWAKHPLDVGSTKEERPNCFYDLVDPVTGIAYPANPNRVWAFSPDSMERLLNEGKILFHPEGKARPGLKKFFSELKSECKPISTWLQKDEFSIGYNAEGTKIVNEIFGDQKLFDYPKPISLIKLILDQIVDESDLILDFFAGSSTTAHAVMQLNAEDGGNRKFIMVQLPEVCDPKSEAFKAGYKTIADIGKERIRRAGQKVLQEMQKTGIQAKNTTHDLLSQPASQPASQ